MFFRRAAPENRDFACVFPARSAGKIGGFACVFRRAAPDFLLGVLHVLSGAQRRKHLSRTDFRGKSFFADFPVKKLLHEFFTKTILCREKKPAENPRKSRNPHEKHYYCIFSINPPRRNVRGAFRDLPRNNVFRENNY